MAPRATRSPSPSAVPPVSETAANRTISVVPPNAFTLRFLFVVAMVFAAFVVVLYFRSTAGLPPDKAHEQLAGMSAMVVLDLVLVGVIVWAVRRRSVELGPTALTIRAGFYSRTIPRAALQVESGILVSLFEQREIAPRWRTNGIRVPGFRAGWFRLAKGEKALVLVTDPRVVTYLPTREGFALLVSTADLLPALQESAGQQP